MTTTLLRRPLPSGTALNAESSMLSEQFTIEPMPENAAEVRQRVKAAAHSIGFRPPDLNDIELAVGEGITNAILYGSPSSDSMITVSCHFDTDTSALVVEIRDQGRGFDLKHVRTLEDVDSLGGRGLRLMRILTDKLLLYNDGKGMVLRFTKRLVLSA